MPNVSLVVVPVDFSAGSESAASYAAWLAGRLGARILLLHAFVGLGHAAAGVAPGLIDDLQATEASMREQARRDLEAQAARLSRESGAAVETALVEAGASAADAIVRATREAHGDLVVMGTHGRTGLRRAILGSVAERVVRTAECPVVVVK